MAEKQKWWVVYTIHRETGEIDGEWWYADGKQGLVLNLDGNNVNGDGDKVWIVDSVEV